MLNSTKKFLHTASAVLELGYRIIRGVDYQTLSQYILKINQHKDVDSILFEVSRCLKDILDYELFGFALKNGSKVDLWLDPRVYSQPLKEYVSRDLGGQNIDYTMHYFEKNSNRGSHDSDAISMNNLISYKVMDNKYGARLYLLPKKRMLYHHDTIISTIISSLSIALEKNLSIQQLENAAAIDPLTNCYNRRALDSFIKSDVAYAQRSGTELSAIMLDVDNFKEVNDVYGHEAGDAVLKSICELLPGLIRKSDYFARYGGEEFVLILPDTTLYNAVQLADKIRKRIDGHEIRIGDGTLSVSASFGVASLESKRDAGNLLREADERLYKAKAIGKNTVVPSLLPCFADRHFVSSIRAAVPGRIARQTA